MDQQKFVELLKSVQTPDTEKVKAATAELRKTYYPHAQSLLWLLMILTSHDEPSIRQQACIEALRIIPKHWENVDPGQKTQIRQKLMESTINESSTLVRHSAARVISAIAAIDQEKGEWLDLPALLAQAAESSTVAHREVAIYILYTLLEATGDGFLQNLPQLFTLFGKTIQDPESSEVRANTMLALGRIAMLIDSDEDSRSVESFQATIPAMVKVLNHAIVEADSEQTMQAFDVFQTLLGCENVLLSMHFQDLLQFMISIAINIEHEDEARSQAISFMMQCLRYRRMKIQGMKDMGKQMTTVAMRIATEAEDDDDDDDDVTPWKSALALLDSLASELPPRQVIVPLLEALPSFVNNEQAAFRRAGISSLGMCVEGAPDFVATQLGDIIPVVVKLLNDPDVTVRFAAIKSLARLADDLAEDLSKEHATVVPALLKNLDAAATQAISDPEQTSNIKVLAASCTALDSLLEGMSKEVAHGYASELVPRLGRLLSHPELKIKASAASAMGSLAGAAEESFLPYFENTMTAFSSYIVAKDGVDDFELRATVYDAMGGIAAAAGRIALQPYVKVLMESSEEALHLGHPRLRESAYILWSTLAKLYESEFTPFLPGVVRGLLDCLEQDEDENEVELGAEASDLLGQEVIIAGKKIKVVSATDKPEDLDDMGEDDDDEDWDDDFTAVTAIAMEKEIALEVLGDIISHARENFLPYLEKSVESAMTLVDHSYEGVRKAAISTLWRAYACLWALMEDKTGSKWSPGIPLKEQPSPELVKLGEVVATATMAVWGDEMDRDIVTEINRIVAATLKLCGPAILTHANMMEQVTTIVSAIITKSHPCQMDLGDDEDQADVHETSEYDWLVIDTALDVVIGLAAALGADYAELHKVFEKPILRFASSTSIEERTQAMGVIAEITTYMGAGVTPYTETFLKMILRRLSDEDEGARSNAAYAAGRLIEASTASAIYLPHYNTILQKLEPMLQTEVARSVDNACGCVSRMIAAQPDKVPLASVLPVLVSLLPLRADYEENKPIYECLIGLYQAQNPTMLNLTSQLMPVLEKVLGEPQEQLDDDTRAKVDELVTYLRST